jgi:hypothetical protein
VTHIDVMWGFRGFGISGDGCGWVLLCLGIWGLMSNVLISGVGMSTFRFFVIENN